MRILHLDTGRLWHGGQIQMRLLIAALRNEGIECGVRSPLMNQPIDNPDLTHCHDARSHTFARKPFVVSRRVGFPVKRGILSRWKYSRAAGYLAVSRYTAGVLESAGIPSARIHLVPDAIPPMPAADRKSGRVLLLSKNGQYVPGTVPVRRLEEDLRDCDVFVYLSDMEGLGSAALLAQAAGVPVVASRVGGLPEAVKFGELVDGPDEVPAAIERARTIEVDTSSILREFGIPAMVERTIAVYRKVLGC